MRTALSGFLEYEKQVKKVIGNGFQKYDLN